MKQGQRNGRQLVKENFLNAMKKTLGIRSAAMRLADVKSHMTIINWIREDPEFKKRLEEIEYEQCDFAESQLLKLIKEGNPSAIIFYAKTKLRHRGYGEKVELTAGNGDAKIARVQVEVIDSRDKAEATGKGEKSEADGESTDDQGLR